MQNGKVKNWIHIKKIFWFKTILSVSLFLPLQLAGQMPSTENRIREIQQYMRSQGNNNPGNQASPRQGANSANRQAPTGAGSRTYIAKITLFNATVLTGKIVLENKSITVTQVKAGIRFIKELALKDIREISIEKYESYQYVKYKNFTAYYFLPILFKIRDNSGIVYFYTKPLNWLNKFVLFNEMGRAKVSTVYVDYWMIKERRWYNSRSSDRDYPQNNQPGEICQRIVLQNS